MSSKSKQIGTRTETMVVNYLKANGFPDAERRVLHGTADLGDILVCKGVIAQVKGGLAAENASDARLRQWYADTQEQRSNANATHAFLVVKRSGHGVTKIGGWWVVSDNNGLLARFRLDEYTRYLRRLTGREEIPDDLPA
jgi:hypothetical protein